MCENIKIYNDHNMKMQKYTNVEIYKYTCSKVIVTKVVTII